MSLNLLDLPPALLQHISSYVAPSRLPVLLLICKKLEASSLDAFARESVDRLVCYGQEPARLKRIVNLVSVPRFAGRIKHLVITADCLECKTARDFEFAARAPSAVA